MAAPQIFNFFKLKKCTCTFLEAAASKQKVDFEKNNSSEQCDQMLEYKVAQISPKLSKKLARQFLLFSDVFQNRPKSRKIFKLFFLENLSPRAIKVAESGHPASSVKNGYNHNSSKTQVHSSRKSFLRPTTRLVRELWTLYKHLEK